MAFRAVRTAAVSTLVLVLSAGCGQDQQLPDRLPQDRTQLSLEDLDRLPWYGAQRRGCQQVASHLKQSGDYTETDSVTIRIEDGELVIEPATVVTRRGTPVEWDAGGLVWVARFTAISPFADSALTVRGGGARNPPAQQAADRGVIRTPVAGREESCGRYYFFVAAYDPSEPDRVYLADPPWYIM